MHELAVHYQRMRQSYPHDKLLLVSDIDGTIIDTRYMILATFQAYDRAHHTHFFSRLRVDDIRWHENEIEPMLQALHVPREHWDAIIAWYLEHRWTPEMIFHSHRPFRGVLDMIRWFQLQPNTDVGLVTGRPEILREETLRSLNILGQPYRVKFRNEMLYMNPGDWEEVVPQVKVAGLRYFQEMGFRVFAFIDNEPPNLKAVAQADPTGEVLLLHADTIFESKRTRPPRRSVRGKEYRLAELIPGETALPQRVQLAWHGVNDHANLRQFLASEIRWAEVDVRFDPSRQEVILRHDSFEEAPVTEEERWLTLAEALDKIKAFERAIKLDLKSDGQLLERVLALVAQKGLADESLWFNANIEDLQESGFRRLASEHPQAILQCPIDFLIPLMLAMPEKAHEILETLRRWGINRFSLSWKHANSRELFNQMDHWGYDVNIYNVPDLESFLQAVLLLPRSVTADFNFPRWHYYGRGSGHEGRRYEYLMVEKRE
ncbi:MAG: DUF2181 domain-containing protein [Chloroflexi bacterium]|nr:DUF2181 domain-containing protein [Chloroflexota bacterium]